MDKFKSYKEQPDTIMLPCGCVAEKDGKGGYYLATFCESCDPSIIQTEFMD